MIFLGVESEDKEEDIAWLCRKIVNLRIFSDDDGLMNKSLNEIGGELLIVSQFTLHASTRKGNRPSFIKAASPVFARKWYDSFIESIETMSGKPVKSGLFAADMKIQLCNDGPVTIIIDTKTRE